MKIKVTDKGEAETFTEDVQFAYKDGKIYDILVSNKSYYAGDCLGRMRVIVEKLKTGFVITHIVTFGSGIHIAPAKELTIKPRKWYHIFC